MKRHGVRVCLYAGVLISCKRLSDLFCRYTLSHQAFMAALARLVLRVPYPGGIARALVLTR